MQPLVWAHPLAGGELPRIRDAARGGAAFGEIAAAVGLSNSEVQQVIRRGGDLEAMHVEPTHTTASSTREHRSS